MSNENKGFGLLSIFGEMRDGIRGIGKYHNSITKGSLPESLKNTMVNPLVLVESSIQHNERITDILYGINDIYASLYISVASRLVALDVDAVRVTRILEKLATDRDPLGSIAGMESSDSTTNAILLGLEAIEGSKTSVELTDKLTKVFPNNQLSVGKMVELVFESKGTKVAVPVSIRLNTNIASNQLMCDIFKANYMDFNIIRRFKQFSLYGETTLFESLTGLDYIKRQERIALQDVDGVIRSHFRDSAKEVGFSVLTGEVAINRASAVMVLDKANIKSVEAAARGRMDKFRDRERYMDGTACMLLAIVDQEDEMVRFYLRGIKDGQTLKFNQLKLKGDGSSSIDMEKILGGAINGSVPSLV